MENYLSGVEGTTIFSFLDMGTVLNLSEASKSIHENIHNSWNYFLQRDFQTIKNTNKEAFSNYKLRTKKLKNFPDTITTNRIVHYYNGYVSACLEISITNYHNDPIIKQKSYDYDEWKEEEENVLEIIATDVVEENDEISCCFVDGSMEIVFRFKLIKIDEMRLEKECEMIILDISLKNDDIEKYTFGATNENEDEEDGLYDSSNMVLFKESLHKSKK
eukprot:gene10680-3301_t